MAPDFDSGSSDTAGQNFGRKQTGQVIDGLGDGVDSVGGSVQDSARGLPLEQLDDLYAPVLTQTARQTDPVFNAVKCPEGYKCYKIPSLPRNQEARVFRLQERVDQLRGRWKDERNINKPEYDKRQQKYISGRYRKAMDRLGKVLRADDDALDTRYGLDYSNYY